MTNAIQPAEYERPMTLQEVKAQVNLIQQVLREVMKQGEHYGVIPGTQKPTLYKPGSEKILSTFRLAVDPEVEDLSTPDEARYRIRCKILTMDTGRFIGAGVGECSSNEMKYKWRAAVCEAEYDETPVDRRRNFWKKGNPPYQVKQVRADHTDIANTVLKMAKKRAQIDATLTCTAASDIFTQDLEDLQENGIDPADQAGDGNEEARPAVRQPVAKGSAPAAAPPKANGGNPLDFHGLVKFIGARTFQKKAKPDGSPGGEGSVHVITAANGLKYETFSDTFVDTARTALANGTAVHITATKDNYGLKIATLDPVLEG